jgi:hypothetical protein
MKIRLGLYVSDIVSTKIEILKISADSCKYRFIYQSGKTLDVDGIAFEDGLATLFRRYNYKLRKTKCLIP